MQKDKIKQDEKFLIKEWVSDQLMRRVQRSEEIQYSPYVGNRMEHEYKK